MIVKTPIFLNNTVTINYKYSSNTYCKLYYKHLFVNNKVNTGNTLVYGPGFSHWKWVPSSGFPLLWVFPHLGFPTSGCFLHLGAATSFYSAILYKPFLSSENSEQLLLLLVRTGLSFFSTVSFFDWYPVICMLWPHTQRSISEWHSLAFSSIILASLVACCFKLCSSTLSLKRFMFF